MPEKTTGLVFTQREAKAISDALKGKKRIELALTKDGLKIFTVTRKELKSEPNHE